MRTGPGRQAGPRFYQGDRYGAGYVIVNEKELWAVPLTTNWLVPAGRSRLIDRGLPPVCETSTLPVGE